MAQLFRPEANSTAKISLVVGLTLPVVVLLSGSTLSRSPMNTGVDVNLDQPVPFSHKHHSIELGIDCRFCHTGVETSGYAGLPTTETCMNCHSQIWTNSPLLDPVRKSYETNKPVEWTVVNKLPEFVYFNHSIHVDRGVSCNQCHGPMNEKQITSKGRNLSMMWCLECHREPEKYLYEDEKNPGLTPKQQVFNLYMKKQRDPKGLDLSPREAALLRGDEQSTLDPELIKKGNELLKARGVKKDQLMDCTICHR